jgi:hypothetical protein
MNRSAPPPSPDSPRSSLLQQRWLMALPIIAGVVLLLIAVLLVIVLGLRSLLPSPEGDAGVSLIVTKIAATPTSPASPVTPQPPESLPSCETIISSGDVEIVSSLPISLTLGGESFPVEAVLAEEGWGYPAGSSGSAAWVCGTVVNYVVVLEPVAENETLLAGLALGDEITLRLSNGVQLFFSFEQQGEMETDELASVFEQFEPGLTLLLEQDSGAWLVVTATYVTRVEPVFPSSPESLVRPEVPVRVGDAQVTVQEGYALRSAPDLPGGMMYYLVEFSVENVGTTPLNADFFTMQLQDSLGNRYLPSSVASAFGESGLIEGEIAPDEVVAGSAGYWVPETLAGPELIWTFSPSPGSEVWASVGIPYEGEPEEVAEPARAQVFVTDALLGRDESILIVEGEIRNTGGSLLTVEARDITLSSASGIGELIAAAPPLPWTIEPGQTRVVELQFERPDASSVLLTLLGYSFEISGLE